VFEIFEKLNLIREPVGVKFLFFKPEGVKALSLTKKLSFCELIVEAQETEEPFYFSRENEETCVGKFLLGMEEMAPFAESGQIGPKLGIFDEARANYVFYQYIPRFERNVVNYVLYSKLKNIPFNPDLLIISATPAQAEILMRAASFSTGELYVSKTTPVMGCAWIYIYPFKKKKINFLIPELAHGMKSRRLFPEGSILIFIPYNWIPTVIKNLNTMKWELPSYHSKEEYLQEFGKILQELAEKAKNP